MSDRNKSSQDKSCDTVYQENLRAAYQQLCTSYHNIDDFRMRLLGLLPFASGAGIFLLYSASGSLPSETKAFLTPIGVFGIAVTLGLFFYEIYGIRKCSALIAAGKEIEGLLHIDGHFARRPREVLGIINEPFATAIIYPAVLAAWTLVALVFLVPERPGPRWFVAICIGLFAVLIFVLFFALSLVYNGWLKHQESQVTALTCLNQRLLRAEEAGDQATLDSLVPHDYLAILRPDGEKQDRQAFLKAVPAEKNRGRMADQVDVRLYGNYAVYT